MESKAVADRITTIGRGIEAYGQGPPVLRWVELTRRGVKQTNVQSTTEGNGRICKYEYISNERFVCPKQCLENKALRKRVPYIKSFKKVVPRSSEENVLHNSQQHWVAMVSLIAVSGYSEWRSEIFSISPVICFVKY